jgi:hypothetical protein
MGEGGSGEVWHYKIIGEHFWETRALPSGCGSM